MRYQSKVSLTVELLEGLMKLQEGLHIDCVGYDADRGIVNLYVSSNEKIEGITFERLEAQERAQVGFDLQAGDKEC